MGSKKRLGPSPRINNFCGPGQPAMRDAFTGDIGTGAVHARRESARFRVSAYFWANSQFPVHEERKLGESSKGRMKV
jgi:hypothetical protein